MADALVPYGDTRIVLRHQNSVVLYDPSNRRLVVRDLSAPVDPTSCPHCGRSYGSPAFPEVPGHPDHSGGEARPAYFRMLQDSLPDAAPSAPVSPIKQLAEPILSQAASPRPAATVDEEEEESVSSSAGISRDAFSPGYFSRFFREDGELGRGGKGVVLRVSHVLDGVALGTYACKRVPVGDDHRWLVKILAEVQLLSNLTHENLVQYKHVWLEEVKPSNFGPSVPCAFILQQFCNGGDLHKFIYESKPSLSRAEELKARHRRRSTVSSESAVDGRTPRLLSLDDIYSFFRQITAGINYLHLNDYVHRDLKPSNCLLHHTGSELKVLVSDFGEVQRGDQIREGTGATGTISYCAPEVLKLDPSTRALGEFTTKSDIFSLGMVLHFLCFGQLPYRSADGINEEDEDVEQLKDEISKWAGFGPERDMRDDLPDELYQHLSRLLSTNAGHRPSAQDILQGLDSMGVSAPSATTQSHHSRTRSNERAFGRRTSRASRLDSQSPRLKNIALAPPPPVRRHITPPTKFEKEDSAIESDGEELSKSDSLIVRSHPTSRAVSPLKDDFGLSASAPNLPSPKLLPATMDLHPDPESPGVPAHPRMARAIEIVILVLKLLSLYFPCLPSATRPIILIPLVIFALVDLLGPRQSFWSSLAMVLVHVLVLSIAIMRQSLCMEPQIAWTEVIRNEL